MSNVGSGVRHWGLVGALEPSDACKSGGHRDPELGRRRPDGHWNQGSSVKMIGGSAVGLDGVCETLGEKIRTSAGLIGYWLETW